MPKVVDSVTIEKCSVRLPGGMESFLYTVRKGDRWLDDFDSGEALTLLAHWLLVPGDSDLRMLKPPEAHAEDRKHYGYYDHNGDFVAPTLTREPADAGKDL